MQLFRYLLLAGLLVLAGCSSNDELLESNQTERQLYEAASRQLEKGNYDLAIKNFQLLEAQFPFGPYAEQAQLELIYAYYSSYDLDAAIEAADRFIRLHPQHPNVDYAYYLRGLSNYTQIEGFFDRFLPTDRTRRDPSKARDAFNDFSLLLTRYPNSEYAADTRARMLYLRNLLASYEINVANYYLKRRAFIAAANRGRYVVEHFPQSPAVGDGLAVMVQAYYLLGLDVLAEQNLAILKENFPDHPNLAEDGEFIAYYTEEGAKPGWLAYMTGGLFGRNTPREINSRQ